MKPGFGGWQRFHDRLTSRLGWRSAVDPSELLTQLAADARKEIDRRAEENRKAAATLDVARRALAEARRKWTRIKQGLEAIEPERAKRRTERDRLLKDSNREALERLEILAKELQALDDAETYLQRQVASAESELVEQEAALQRAEASLGRRRKELARLRRKAGK